MFSRRNTRVAWFLIAFAISACVPAPGVAVSSPAAPTGVPSTLSTPLAAEPVTVPAPASAASFLAAYEFPASVDPARHYLFYLHGRIIEEQGLPAIDPNYGEYEYASILETLASYGFAVVSEQRPKGTDADAYAQRLVAQISQLLDADVPAGHITVVGASKGASIAVAASYLLKDSSVNFVLLGSCHPSMVAEWKSNHMTLYGNVLAIYDSADHEYAGSCEELFRLSEGTGLGRHQETVLHVGTGHGILYGPLDEWILPTVEWAKK